MKSILVTVWVIQRVCSKIAMATNNIWSVSSDRLIWSLLRLISNLDTEIALLFYTDQRTFSIFLGSQISVILANKTFLRREREEYAELSALSGKLFTFSQIHLQLSIKGYRIPLLQLLQTDKSAITTQIDRPEESWNKINMLILELEWILFLVLTIAAISFPRKSATKRKYRYQKLKFIGV